MPTQHASRSSRHGNGLSNATNLANRRQAHFLKETTTTTLVEGRQNAVRSCSASVGMMQSTQDRTRDDSPGRLQRHGNWTQTEAAMRAVAVVVIREFRQHPPEGRRIDHDDVV